MYLGDWGLGFVCRNCIPPPLPKWKNSKTPDGRTYGGGLCACVDSSRSCFCLLSAQGAAVAQLMPDYHTLPGPVMSTITFARPVTRKNPDPTRLPQLVYSAVMETFEKFSTNSRAGKTTEKKGSIVQHQWNYISAKWVSFRWSSSSSDIWIIITIICTAH